jgi:hypothetical protein
MVIWKEWDVVSEDLLSLPSLIVLHKEVEFVNI